jgi:hypothetical protein
LAAVSDTAARGALWICVVAAAGGCESYPAHAAAQPAASNGAPVPVSHAEGVVRGTVQPGARNCYNDALRSGVPVVGMVKVAIHVAPDGSVDDATTTGGDTLPQSLIDCIKAVARTAKFEPPGGEGATIWTSFDFKPAAPANP